MFWIPDDVKASLFNGICSLASNLGTRFWGEENRIRFEQWRTDRASQ